jgi:hypothetical protein
VVVPLAISWVLSQVGILALIGTPDKSSGEATPTRLSRTKGQRSELVRSLRTGPGAEISRTTPKLLPPPPFSIAGHAAAS